MPRDEQINTNLVPQYLQSVTPVTSVYTHTTRSAARVLCTLVMPASSILLEVPNMKELDYGII